MNTFSQRSERRRATHQAILEAARQEFEQAGFEAATVRAIAARAGVSAGSVLNHFVGKRQLLHAALFDDLEATIERALAGVGEGSLEGQLLSLARAVFGYYERRPGLSRTLLKESLFAGAPWAERFAGQVSRVHGVITALAAKARSRGELREGVDLELLGVSFFSFFYFALIAWVQGAQQAPLGLFERLMAEHLRGLAPAD